LEIDAIRLPHELNQLMNEIRDRLKSVEAKLAHPNRVIRGDEAEFFSLLGNVHQQLGNFPRAEEWHRRALNENAYVLRSHLALANTASRRNDRDQEDRSVAAAE